MRVYISHWDDKTIVITARNKENAERMLNENNYFVSVDYFESIITYDIPSESQEQIIFLT